MRRRPSSPRRGRAGHSLLHQGSRPYPFLSTYPNTKLTVRVICPAGLAVCPNPAAASGRAFFCGEEHSKKLHRDTKNTLCCCGERGAACLRSSLRTERAAAMERRTDARAARRGAHSRARIFLLPRSISRYGMQCGLSKAAKAPLNLQGVGQCTKAGRIPSTLTFQVLRIREIWMLRACFFFSLDLNRRSRSGKLARCRLYGNFAVCNNMPMRTPSRPTIQCAAGVWKIIDWCIFVPNKV